MTDRVVGMLEDVLEAQSAEELDALVRLIPEYPDVDVSQVRGSIEERRAALDKYSQEIVGSDVVQRLLQKLQELKAQEPAAKPKVELPRLSRKYKLVHDRLDWTQKPQVHALMSIIKMRWTVGDVFEEEDLLALIQENIALLNTVQTAERVFAYYKGAGGFLEHGNFEKVF